MGKVAAQADFPTTFEDRPEDFPAQPRRWAISHTNRRTAAFVRQLLLPPPVRHAFPSARRQSPMTGMFDLLHPHDSETPSRSKFLETHKGPLLLRDFCPPSLVERLIPESGM
jgi:hypothetical protein